MILKAKYHPFIYPFFNKWYSRWLIKRHFSRVEVNGQFHDRGLPLLVIANHTTWWDGFWVMHLNRTVFNRKFNFMMEEAQLRRHWYFNHAGGFSIRKNSRSVLETLDYAKELLCNRDNMVLMFPQGEIESVHNHPVKFNKGASRLMERCPDILVLFVVCLTDYFSAPKPGIYLYFEEYQHSASDEGPVAIALEQAYNTFFRQCVEEQKRKAF